MIRLKNVTKVFSNGLKALIDLNLHISKEEFLFIVGPSGAGKTTLLKLLYREEIPSEGEVLIDGINIGRIKSDQIPYLRRNIGVVFQDYKLLPRRTVQENVAFALRVLGLARLQIKRQVNQALELVGISSKANCFPEELSGGEQQRVCIARAIVNNPPLVLADEPTGNVDPETTWSIMQLLEKINLRRTTVIVATHDKTIVDGMRKRVVALEAGRLIRDQQLGSYDE